MIETLATWLLGASGALTVPQLGFAPQHGEHGTPSSQSAPVDPGPRTLGAPSQPGTDSAWSGGPRSPWGSGGGVPKGGGGGRASSKGGLVTAAPVAKRSEPPPSGAPPESSPDGGQSLLFYSVRIGGGGMGTGTGYYEEFIVSAPDQSKPRPLLVVFHKFGVSQQDIWLNTEFFQEAVRKKWHIVAPLSASGVHFGSRQGQINTEKAIEWMFDNFNVDRSRIYGIGFSMGGGAVTNFAARHLDPAELAFAAVVDHTGGIAHEDTYVQAPSAQFIFDFWFGDGSPGSTDPFEMARACLLDFDPDTLVVDPTNDLARNLVTVPLRVTRASIEPLPTAYLPRQCDVLVSHLTTLGGVVDYDIVPFFGHTWNMLDDHATVDWLGVHRLKVPTAHDTLADEDRRYWHFDVVQEAAGAFTPFSWDLDVPGNALTLSATENLTQLGVDTASAGLDPAQVLTVTLSTADNLADEVALEGYAMAPSAVHRDGVQQFVNWTYQATEGLLVLQEWDGTQAHTWVVTP